MSQNYTGMVGLVTPPPQKGIKLKYHDHGHHDDHSLLTLSAMANSLYVYWPLR